MRPPCSLYTPPMLPPCALTRDGPHPELLQSLLVGDVQLPCLLQLGAVPPVLDGEDVLREKRRGIVRGEIPFSFSLSLFLLSLSEGGGGRGEQASEGWGEEEQ